MSNPNETTTNKGPTCVYLCVYMCVCLCVYVYVCVCVCVRVYERCVYAMRSENHCKTDFGEYLPEVAARSCYALSQN